MYHRIVKNHSDDIANPFSIEEKEFRQQLRMLERLNYTPITFEDYYLYLKDRLTLPKKPIILTFDDGLEGMHEIAFPVLKEFNMKAVVFVMGDRTLQKASWYKSTGRACSLITDEQILELRSAGFEIGSHGMTHTPLPGLGTQHLKEEILRSKRNIEDLLGEAIFTFSYPYGLLDEQVQRAAKEAGFDYACGVYTGPAQFGKNYFDIRRLAIKYETKKLAYLMRLLTPYQYVEWFYSKIRVRTRKPKYGPEWKITRKAPVAEYDLTSPNNV